MKGVACCDLHLCSEKHAFLMSRVGLSEARVGRGAAEDCKGDVEEDEELLC